MDIQFDWERRDAFVRQPNGTLFSWSERYQCLIHLSYGVVNELNVHVILTIVEESRDIEWKSEEPLIERLQIEGIVKEVFPLHDENQRNELLQKWAYNWMDLTSQPIDAIYSYFGAKVATYFSFLGMYTKWILFPSVLGIFFHSVNFGSWRVVVLSIFFMIVILWSVLFLQFWRRKNAKLLLRWNTSHSGNVEPGSRSYASEQHALSQLTPGGVIIGPNNMPPNEQRTTLQRHEWHENFKSLRNNVIVIAGILCLQLPFELAYAHFNHIIHSQIWKYALTVLYVLTIQYYMKFGGNIAERLVKTQHHNSKEARADCLVYKVFGLYFMQYYIGLFYHAFFRRDIKLLRTFLIQRLIVSQVLSNVVENLGPYVKYHYTKYFAIKRERKGHFPQHTSRIEKEYMKPSYTASVGEGMEDGLFDDFLELALQFGMVTMFACAFPLVFVFAAVNNLMEIRTDSLKLLALLRRPIPRAASSIGAWLNIFEFLGVIAICSNCALLVCLHHEDGKWEKGPGLVTIVLIEHALLLMKFGFSCLVPEEPAWVRATRMRRAQDRDMCSAQLLQNIFELDKKKDC
ncbi:anoctamin-like protein Os01g0706700 isoform X2 [Cryptomeria japonica]|nr:anoctamin-like protein Os01g0706700 isoform X2 [Cryptomeria japonica]XP_057828564.2 anoctamin-like protein Os01g0706700 isoform X2 [Cryptomeria japonica]